MFKFFMGNHNIVQWNKKQYSAFREKPTNKFKSTVTEKDEE